MQTKNVRPKSEDVSVRARRMVRRVSGRMSVDAERNPYWSIHLM